MADIENALRAVRAEPSLMSYLLQTARPALEFARHERPDAEIPTGVSKIGGDPDLPPGMEWPLRPPFADAADRRKRLLGRADGFEEAEIRPGLRYS